MYQFDSAEPRPKPRGYRLWTSSAFEDQVIHLLNRRVGMRSNNSIMWKIVYRELDRQFKAEILNDVRRAYRPEEVTVKYITKWFRAWYAQNELKLRFAKNLDIPKFVKPRRAPAAVAAVQGDAQNNVIDLVTPPRTAAATSSTETAPPSPEAAAAVPATEIDRVAQLEAELRKLKDREEERLLCPICFERKVNRTMTPCGHPICDVCYRGLPRPRQCPICRTTTKSVIPYFDHTLEQRMTLKF